MWGDHEKSGFMKNQLVYKEDGRKIRFKEICLNVTLQCCYMKPASPGGLV